MSARTDAYARYLEEIYKEYDAQVDNDHLVNEFHLSTVEVQLEQIISLSENFSIEDLIVLVLIQASEEAQDDLREILEDMRAVTQAKRRLRDTAARLKKRAEPVDEQERDEYRQRESEREFERIDTTLLTQLLVTVAAHQSNREALAQTDEVLRIRRRVRRAGVDETVDQAKDDLDSLSELGEMESLRLQMAMDRRSKFMTALSNILKKMSDTNDAIVQNLK
jgi:hypothetical protein